MWIGLLFVFGLANLLSGQARDSYARLILKWACSFFFFWAFPLALFDLRCSGSVLKGLVNCSPTFLAEIGNALSLPLLLGQILIPLAGIPLLILACFREYLSRRNIT
jgi:hypothetical protein